MHEMLVPKGFVRPALPHACMLIIVAANRVYSSPAALAHTFPGASLV